MSKKDKETKSKKSRNEGFQKTGKLLSKDDLFDKETASKSPPEDSSNKKK